jgi:S-adenosylmethionine uptake transporter
MRAQAKAARPPEISFFQNLIVALALIAAMPLVGTIAWPADHWPALLLASLLSTAGLLLFAFAYARGEANYLSITEYSAFVWASALGWLIFRESVSGWTAAGAVLIVGGCLIAAQRTSAATGQESEIEAVA